MPTTAKMMDLKAAADFLGNGAIELPMYEREITDIVRRNTPTLSRLKAAGATVLATGHPHRYLEQTAIATATATDPRNITPTPTSPTRVERAAMIKATVAQSNFSHFDVEVTQQQGMFPRIEAKDIADLAQAVTIKEGSMIWVGTDTSLSAPSTLEFMGMIKQVIAGGNITYVDAGASIIDALKTAVAELITNPAFTPIPSAIYMNGLLADLIDQEAKASQYHFNVVEFVAGVKVNGIMTQAGVLPMPSDPFIPQLQGAGLTLYGLTALPGGATNAYLAFIMQENMIEIPYVNASGGGPEPRVFQLGLLSGLQGQFVSLAYKCALIKGATYAHALVVVYR